MKQRLLTAFLCVTVALGALTPALAAETEVLPAEMTAGTEALPTEETAGTETLSAEETAGTETLPADGDLPLAEETAEPTEMAEPAEKTPGIPTSHVIIDGALASFVAEIYDGTAYTPLAATVEALWTGAQAVCQGSTVTVQAEGLTLSANAGNCYLELNGRCLYVEEGFKIDALGDVMVPTRLIADALGASVAWSGDVVLTRNALPVLESGDTFYDAYTLDLISRVIMHESGNQCLEGKIAVGNVILNRVASPLFPNTVYDVLFQKNQFPGATNATPTSECIIAAKLALEGVNVVPNAYWFNRAGLSSWAAKNKTLLTIIEDHAFYG